MSKPRADNSSGCATCGTDISAVTGAAAVGTVDDETSQLTATKDGETVYGYLNKHASDEWELHTYADGRVQIGVRHLDSSVSFALSREQWLHAVGAIGVTGSRWSSAMQSWLRKIGESGIAHEADDPHERGFQRGLHAGFADGRDRERKRIVAMLREANEKATSRNEAYDALRDAMESLDDSAKPEADDTDG